MISRWLSTYQQQWYHFVQETCSHYIFSFPIFSLFLLNFLSFQPCQERAGFSWIILHYLSLSGYILGIWIGCDTRTLKVTWKIWGLYFLTAFDPLNLMVFNSPRDPVLGNVWGRCVRRHIIFRYLNKMVTEYVNECTIKKPFSKFSFHAELIFEYIYSHINIFR